MADLDLLDTVEETLHQGRAALDSQPLSERFCLFVEEIRQASAEPISASLQQDVDDLFLDVNRRVVAYNEQYSVLVEELGLFCENHSPTVHVYVQTFFQSLLDFLQIAFTVYQADPGRLTPFSQVLTSLTTGLTTGAGFVPEEDLPKALLLRLIPSAWAVTASPSSLEETASSLATQTGGKKRLTRKRKHT
jgi:hypothetical protein